MKNWKRKLAIFATATLLSLGSSTLAMQGTERFNLKPAKEITEKTRFSYSVYSTNERLRELGYEIEDESKTKLERVFYGVATKDEMGIGVLLYKDTSKKLNEENNYKLIVHFRDTGWFIPDEHRGYIAYDGQEMHVDYNKFIERLEDFFNPQRRDIGGATWFPITILDTSKMSEEERKGISDAIYTGVRYKDKETGEMKDLVYVINIVNGKEGISFKGYANGEVTLQDTDGDILWH